MEIPSTIPLRFLTYYFRILMKKIEINEISKTALSIEILLPKKIVLNELITFYENLGDLNKEKNNRK